MTENKTLTERLLLNTTPEERIGLKALLERSRASNPGALMREAFEQYIGFHKRVLAGEEIIVSTVDGTGGHSIYIPLKWEDSGYTDIDQNSEVGEVKQESKEAPARKVLEFRLNSELKKSLQQFVAKGYAPSLTALAGGALEVYSIVLTAGEKGNEVRARRKDGTEVVLIEPQRRMSSPLEKIGPQPAQITGFAQPPKRNILVVLDEEKNLRPMRFVVDSPILTGERHADVAAKVEEAVLANLREGATYIYILDEKKDQDSLDQWINGSLAPKICWDDIVPNRRSAVEALKEGMTGIALARANASPAWCLIRAGVFPVAKMSAIKSRTGNNGDTELMLGRMFNFACWYAEMDASDGRVWGYQFTSTGKSAPLQTFLKPMGDETIREQLWKLKQFGETGVFVPTPMAENVLQFPNPASEPSPKGRVSKKTSSAK